MSETIFAALFAIMIPLIVRASLVSDIKFVSRNGLKLDQVGNTTVHDGFRPINISRTTLRTRLFFYYPIMLLGFGLAVLKLLRGFNI
jgi:hypothetical protein